MIDQTSGYNLKAVIHETGLNAGDFPRLGETLRAAKTGAHGWRPPPLFPARYPDAQLALSSSKKEEIERRQGDRAMAHTGIEWAGPITK